MLLRVPLVGLFALLAGCGRQPGWYAIPPQQTLDLGPDPGGVSAYVKMDDSDADDYIVRDIGGAQGSYRWARLHPELRFRVRELEDLHFIAAVAIPEAIFPSGAVVHVGYAIDGRALGSLSCDHPGKYAIDTPVPASWIRPGEYLHVTFTSDRPWVSPDDGARLSFLLFEAGFRR